MFASVAVKLVAERVISQFSSIMTRLLFFLFCANMTAAAATTNWIAFDMTCYDGYGCQPPCRCGLGRILRVRVNVRENERPVEMTETIPWGSNDFAMMFTALYSDDGIYACDVKLEDSDEYGCNGKIGGTYKGNLTVVDHNSGKSTGLTYRKRGTTTTATTATITSTATAATKKPMPYITCVRNKLCKPRCPCGNTTEMRLTTDTDGFSLTMIEKWSLPHKPTISFYTGVSNEGIYTCQVKLNGGNDYGCKNIIGDEYRGNLRVIGGRIKTTTTTTIRPTTTTTATAATPTTTVVKRKSNRRKRPKKTKAKIIKTTATTTAAPTPTRSTTVAERIVNITCYASFQCQLLCECGSSQEIRLVLNADGENVITILRYYKLYSPITYFTTNINDTGLYTCEVKINRDDQNYSCNGKIGEKYRGNLTVINRTSKPDTTTTTVATTVTTKGFNNDYSYVLCIIICITLLGAVIGIMVNTRVNTRIVSWVAYYQKGWLKLKPRTDV